MPTFVARAFNGNYVKYVINGDKVSSTAQYFNKIMYYLHRLINNYKRKGE